MLTTKYNVLDRAQFQLLRKAKQIVKKEFDRDLLLQKDDVLDRLYEYAIESKEEALFNILYDFKQLGEEPLVAPFPKPGKTLGGGGRVAVGDIVDGQRCIAIYRGKPVFD